MPRKPETADGYAAGSTALVRSLCLSLATRLGDYLDELVVVGGLVPPLLIPDESLSVGEEGHVGTMDLDLGLQLTLLDDRRYVEFAEQLRRSDLVQACTPEGHAKRQCWTTRDLKVSVDFLIPPGSSGLAGGRLQSIQADLAAFVTPGLELAFVDQLPILLEGLTLRGEKARRNLNVCGPGASMVLKALAFDKRGENKDAYDLYYVARHFGDGPASVAHRLRPLLSDPLARSAVELLREHFSDVEATGPMRVAYFLANRPDVEIQADVVGFVLELLRLLDKL